LLLVRIRSQSGQFGVRLHVQLGDKAYLYGIDYQDIVPSTGIQYHRFQSLSSEQRSIDVFWKYGLKSLRKLTGLLPQIFPGPYYEVPVLLVLPIHAILGVVALLCMINYF